MHPDSNTQHTKIEITIFPSILMFISPTITVIAQHYIGLQKNSPAKNSLCSRSTAPYKAQDFLGECDTLFFIDHERVKPDRIADLYRIADILHEDVGDPFVAV
jgi:hypothetical protein